MLTFPAASPAAEPAVVPAGAVSQVALGESEIVAVCTPPGQFHPNATVFTINPPTVTSVGETPLGMPAAGSLIAISVPANHSPYQPITISWTGNSACASWRGSVTLKVGSVSPPATPAPTPTPGGGTAGDRCPAALRTRSRMRSLQLQASIARGEARRLFALAEQMNGEAADRFGASILAKLQEIAAGDPDALRFLAGLGGGSLSAPEAAQWAKRLIGGGYRQNQLKKLLAEFFTATRPTLNGVPGSAAQRAFNRRLEKQLAELLVDLLGPVRRTGASLAEGAVALGPLVAKVAAGVATWAVADAYIYYFAGLKHLYDARQQSALADRLTREANAAQALALRQDRACAATATGSARGATAASLAQGRPVTSSAGPVARTAATPAHRRLPRVRTLTISLGAMVPARAALQRVFTRELRAFSYIDAGTEALRRSITAGRRGDAAAELRQLAFAKRSFRTAATLRGQVSLLRRSAAAALRRAGVVPVDVQVQSDILAAAASSLGVPRFVRALAPVLSRSSLKAQATGGASLTVDPLRVAVPEALQQDAESIAALRAMASKPRATLVAPSTIGIPRTARRARDLRLTTAVLPDGASLTIAWKRPGARSISQRATVTKGRIAVRTPGRRGRYTLSVTQNGKRIARTTIQVR